MDGILLTMSKDDFISTIRQVVAEVVGGTATAGWGGGETVSVEDICERYGLSRCTYLKGVHDGKYPQPLNTHTKEYRFDPAAVAEAFSREHEAERKLALRPDMKVGRHRRPKAEGKRVVALSGKG